MRQGSAVAHHAGRGWHMTDSASRPEPPEAWPARSCSRRRASRSGSPASPRSTASTSTSTQGEFVGLIGPNGAGQDDVLQLPARHAAPRRGARSSSTGRTSAACPSTSGPGSGFGRTFQRLELFAGMIGRATTSSSPTAPARRGPALEGPAQPVEADGRRGRAVPTRCSSCWGSTTEADEPVETLSLGRGRLVELGPGAHDAARSCCCSTSRRRASTCSETAALAETLRTVQQEHELRGAARRARRRDGAEPRHAGSTCSTSAQLIASRPDRRRAERRRGPQGLPRGHRVSRARPHRVDARASATGRSSSCATSRPGYGPFRSLFGVSFTVASGRCRRAARLERLGQDDRGARASGPAQADRRPVLFDGPRHHRQRAYKIARDRHRARARGPLGVRVAHGRGEPVAHVPRRCSAGRGAKPALDEALRAVPAPR